MANHLAIAAVARTVLELVRTNCPREDFAGEPKFLLYQSHDFGKDVVNEGFSLMVYRVTINGATRNRPPRRGPDGLRRKPALPLDLHFLLTPWAGEAERQLRLLGWAMHFIEDHTILPAALLNQSLSRREQPAFSDDEAVELICDPPGLADYLGLWDKYKARWQTPVTYTARMVMIESDISQPETTPVVTRDMRHGVEPPEAPA